MADTFYSLAETAEKLGKSENAIKDMIKSGELREYRDGANVLFKTEDVDKLAIGDIDLLAEADESDIELGPSESGEISLASSGGDLNVDEDIFALTDTTSGKGPQGSSINILGETDSTEYKVSDDTKSETRSLKLGSESSAGTGAGTGAGSGIGLGGGEAKIEEDVNLDSFGSGSGLLDLSLQADDTSLGADVLEDIYSPDAAAAEAAAPAMVEPDGSAGVTAQTDEIFDSAPAAEAPDIIEPSSPAAEPAEAAPVMAYAAAPVYAAQQEAIDPQSGVFSALLCIGLLVMAFTAAIAVSGAQGITGGLLKTLSDGYIIWYIVAGLMVLSFVVLGVGTLATGRSGAPKAPKAPAPPKAPKTPKAPKPKKVKK
jgi:excisionase family DNA binding protein